jgi:hypothetical protein
MLKIGQRIELLDTIPMTGWAGVTGTVNSAWSGLPPTFLPGIVYNVRMFTPDGMWVNADIHSSFLKPVLNGIERAREALCNSSSK